MSEDRGTVIADFRLAALEATNRLQQAIRFGDEHKAEVENTIFDLMKDAFERGLSGHDNET